MLKDLWGKILDFIYPTKCAICNETIIKRENQICEKCGKELKIDSIMIRIDMGYGNKIKCFSPFEYSGKIKKSILRKITGVEKIELLDTKIIQNFSLRLCLKGLLRNSAVLNLTA